jgi:hypothetical protein
VIRGNLISRISIPAAQRRRHGAASPAPPPNYPARAVLHACISNLTLVRFRACTSMHMPVLWLYASQALAV